MAWNQPGGNNNDRDPWGSNGRNGQQGPPDLDEVLGKLQGKLGNMFGGGGGGGQSSGGSGFGSVGIGIVLGVLLIGWVLAGIYIVEPAEEAVVTRFGAFHRVEQPGPHWAPYMIDRVQLVNVKRVRSADIGFRNIAGQGSVEHESLMLTKDENIVDLQFAVQFQVKDAPDFLFKVNNPDETLRQATESAVREIVGKETMDSVLTEGRSAVAEEARTAIQVILDRYGTGLLVLSVNMQQAQPPEPVQAAFADAVKAREDEERTKNEARAYAADIVPKARGEANAFREQALAYKERVVAAAEGETSRFLKVLTEYKKAPEVTRQRIYLETVESVLANSNKVMIDVEGGNNLTYLPLDRLMQRSNDTMAGRSSQLEQSVVNAGRSALDDVRRPRNDSRGRTR
ncbi:MAG: FtsH protease activity modulator HflK [Pseudomonadota bacterium]